MNPENEVGSPGQKKEFGKPGQMITKKTCFPFPLPPDFYAARLDLFIPNHGGEFDSNRASV